ncbi:MAG: flagellar biosynthesis protein FlhB [Spirochaetes bacterium]|jgi:type III secretion system FlhB-like substrate exporter|nr:flagellar biosynthesis protein FlhB [Spirochaetota bacterium]
MEKAIALRYDETLPAPLVVAKGSAHVAERIERVAEEAGVQIVADPALAESLVFLDIGELIPEDLYGAVAEILAFVLRAEGRVR